MNQEFSVIITGEDLAVERLQQALSALTMDIRGVPTKLAFQSKADKGDAALRIHTAYSFTCDDVRAIKHSDSNQFVFVVNQLGCGREESCKCAYRSSISKIANSLGYFIQTVQSDSDIDRNELQKNLHNLVRILGCGEPKKTIDTLLSRYMNYSADPEGFAYKLMEANCAKKTSLSNHHKYQTFPVSLVQAPLDQNLLERAWQANQVQNDLWMRLSLDTDYLLELCSKIESDSFVANLTAILRKVKASKTAQRARLSISRNDFMLDKSGQLKQVEYNLIAAGMGPITESHAAGLQLQAAQWKEAQTGQNLQRTHSSRKFLVRAMKAAWKHYGNKDAVILMVAERHCNNIDQYSAAVELAKCGIGYCRYYFDELADLLEVDSVTGVATVLGQEIALVYFRDGYVPHQYNSKAWEVREQLELSRAIKCPDVSLQLVNMKYFQYVFNSKEPWIRLGFTEADYEANKPFFCDIKILQDFDNSKEALLAHVEQNGGANSWVLKPQREGGANNFYGEDIFSKVASTDIEELQSYILMERIHPVTHTQIHTNWSKVNVGDAIDEYGFFHFKLAQNPAEAVAEGQGGFLIRSKFTGVDEGGVSSGFAVINSVQMH